jgi:hypothetical protein
MGILQTEMGVKWGIKASFFQTRNHSGEPKWRQGVGRIAIFSYHRCDRSLTLSQGHRVPTVIAKPTVQE